MLSRRGTGVGRAAARESPPPRVDGARAKAQTGPVMDPASGLGVGVRRRVKRMPRAMREIYNMRMYVRRELTAST